VNLVSHSVPQSRSASHVDATLGRKLRVLTGQGIARREQVEFYTFPCVVADVGGTPPATWSKIDGDAVLTCPLCGQRNVIAEGKPEDGCYKIDSRGLIYPSVLCENMACDFDHYVLLQGWKTMGRFGRKRDNERGLIFYCLAWAKYVRENGVAYWKIQPFEYCHATSQEHARETWTGLMLAEKGRIIGIAPSIDPHVSGDGDPRESILHLDR